MWRESIEKYGFTTIPNVLSHAEVEQLLHELNHANLRRSRAGIRHAMACAPIAALARDSRLIGIAQEALGPTAFPFRATVFDKSRNANWLVVWHQDTALPLLEKRELAGWGPWSVKDGLIYAHAPADALSQVLALRIHLDDSTEKNGPLRVLPRTHNLGVLSDEQVSELSLQLSAVNCLVPRGGVLAMKPLLVHSSSKSVADSSRRIIHIEYAIRPAIAAGLELAIA